jgi:hypothetical protein
MNQHFQIKLKELVTNTYTQHEYSHGKFKSNHEAAYLALTNAIQAAAHAQMTAPEFQEWNTPITIKALIERIWNNTRAKNQRQKRQRQQQEQPGTTNSNSCKRQRTHTLSGHAHTQPSAPTPVQGRPPTKKTKSRASTRNQFNRVTYATYPMTELLSTAYKEVGGKEAQQARTRSAIRKEFTKNLNIRKHVEANINWTANKERICGHCTARLMPNATCKTWEWQQTDDGTGTYVPWTRNPNSIPSDLYDDTPANSIPQNVDGLLVSGKMCCNFGKEKKEWLPVIPRALWQAYFTEYTEKVPPPETNASSSVPQHPRPATRSVIFGQRARIYNNLFAVSGIGVTPHESKFLKPIDMHLKHNGPSSVTVCGKVFHRVGPFVATGPNSTPLNGAAYWYIFGDDHERIVAAADRDLEMHVMQIIQTELHKHNKIIQLLSKPDAPKPTPTRHIILYCDPTAAPVRGQREIALFHSGKTTMPESNTQRIVVFKLNATGNECFVNVDNWLYEPLQYPLIFVHGTAGWGQDHFKGKQGERTEAAATSASTEQHHKITLQRYMKQMLLCEPVLQILGRLTCEYVVDGYLRILEQRVAYYRLNQRAYKIRMTDRCTATTTSQVEEQFGRVYLPESFTDGPRHQRSMIEDGLAVVRALGN